MLVGILGGGQLGRMLALAGIPLGLRFRVLDPAANAPTDGIAERLRGAYDDPAALDAFAVGLDCATYEFENVPVATVRALAARGVRVFPGERALALTQDRLLEKQFLRDLGVATAPFEGIVGPEELARAVAGVGLPAVLKTRRLGYDGRGQRVVRATAELDGVWDELGGVPLIAEGFVPFERELALIAARGSDGAIACYPLVETHHRDGILRLAIMPAPRSSELQPAAEAIAARALEALEYVGVLAVELFERDGTLLVNELAPRVHNSGHATIEGAETSQFAQHLRAGLGLPLGPATLLGCTAMVNLIGDAPTPAALPAATVVALTMLLRADPRAHVHLYGKEPRPGRKLGHVTLRASDHDTLAARIEAFVAATGIALPALHAGPPGPSPGPDVLRAR